MFGDVWKWTGEFRRSNKNLGCDWKQIGILLKQWNGDGSYWVEKKTYSEEEIAIRYKHSMVNIYCFSNGNGRRSRLIGDVIHSHIFVRKVFTWGGRNLNTKGGARNNYPTA